MLLTTIQLPAQKELVALISIPDSNKISSSLDTVDYIFQNNPDSAIMILRHLLQHFEEMKYTYETLEIYAALSKSFGQRRNYDSALIYTQKALMIANNHSDQKILASLYNTLGIIYDNKALFPAAFRAYQKAEYFASEPLMLSKIWTNMGVTLRYLGQPEKARSYYHKALATAIRINNHNLWVSNLLNIANTYSADNIGSSIYIDSATNVARYFRKYNLLQTSLIRKAKNHILRKNVAKGTTYLEAAKRLNSDAKISENNLWEYNITIGIALIQLGYYDSAKNYLQQRVTQNTKEYLVQTALLSKVYAAKGNYKKAYHLYSIYKETEDSIGKLTIHSTVNNLEILYRAAQKDKKISEQRALLAIRENQLKQKNLWLISTSTIGILAIILFVSFYRNARQKQRLQLSQQENIRLKALMEGEEQERSRMATELHDGIGGILSVAKMNLGSTGADTTEKMLRQEKGLRLLDEVYKELRRTAHNLSPELLHSKGLIAACRDFCYEVAQASQLEIKMQYFGAFTSLAPQLELSAYRVVQEGVHNAVKHAQASRILVQLSQEEDGISITIEDNGIGMPGKEHLKEGIGLKNVRLRVKALNGNLDIDTRPGKGTTIYVRGLNA